MRVSETTLRTVFFYFAYLTFLVFSTFGHIPVLGGYLKLLPNVGVLLLIILFLSGLKQYSKREIRLFIVLFGCSLLLIKTAKYVALFKLVLMIATSKGIDFRRVIKYDFITRLIMTLMMLGLFQAGIAPDVTSYFEGTLRHSMGFQNPNHVGLMSFILIMELVYLADAKLSAFQYLCSILLILFASKTAGSRTAEMMSILSLLFVSIYKFFPSLLEGYCMRWFFKYCPIICAGFTFAGSYLFKNGNALARNLNQILSGRFANIVYHYNKYGFSLLGVDSSTAGRTNDNLYGYCLLGLGMITFLLFMICYMHLIKQAYKGNKALAIILTCFMIYGLSERLWLNVDYNVMMLSFRTLIYHDLT